MHTPAFSNVFVFFAVNNELEFGEEYILGEQKIRLVDSFGKPLPSIIVTSALVRGNPDHTTLHEMEIRYDQKVITDSNGECRIGYTDRGSLVSIRDKKYRAKVVRFFYELGFAPKPDSYLVSDELVEVKLEKLPEPVSMYGPLKKAVTRWDVFLGEVVKPIVLPNREEFKEPADNLDSADVVFRANQVVNGQDCKPTIDSALGGRRTSRGCWSVIMEGRNGWELCYVPSVEREGLREEYLAVPDGYAPQISFESLRLENLRERGILKGDVYLYHRPSNRYGLIELFFDEEKYYLENQIFYRLYLSYSSRVQAVSVNSLSLMPE